MILELGERERTVLMRVLESYESELRGEIGKTDIKKFRDSLHGEEEILKGLIEKVGLLERAA